MRARERLRNSFFPQFSRFVIYEKQKAGFYTARPSPEGLSLDHLYLRPEFQNRGIGSIVMKGIINEARDLGVSISVGALKESASNRFYQSHGFIKTSEGEWDVYYTRGT